MPLNADIFVIQGAPISEEIWKWFNEADQHFYINEYNYMAQELLPRFVQNLFKDLDPSLSATGKNDESPINGFSALDVNDDPQPKYDYGGSEEFNTSDNNSLLNTKDHHQLRPIRRRFNEFTAYDFMTMMEAFMDLASGISKNPEHWLDPITEPPSVILEFIQNNLKNALLYWCLTRGHEERMFRELDVDLYDSAQGATNRCYHYKCYYMYKEINERFRSLEKDFRKIVFNNNEPYSRWTELTGLGCTIDEIKTYIRKVYTGDLDGFILDTIAMIQDKAVTSNHEKLAQLLRLQKLNVIDFKSSSLGPYEAWRYLYPTYFDSVEDRFDDFFKAFPTQCIMFFLDNYLHTSFDIASYTMYNLVVRRDSLKSDKIVSLLSMKQIQRRAYKWYNES